MIADVANVDTTLISNVSIAVLEIFNAASTGVVVRSNDVTSVELTSNVTRLDNADRSTAEI